MTEGESHVPLFVKEPLGIFKMKLRDYIGLDAWVLLIMFCVNVIGWPVYLLTGTTGGPKRGFTSHFFVPNQLFP
jgi:hypothetical protein